MCVGAACQVANDVPSLPWLHGLSDAVVTDQGNDSITQRTSEWSEGDPDCAVRTEVIR